jgi:hypothetical protein
MVLTMRLWNWLWTMIVDKRQAALARRLKYKTLREEERQESKRKTKAFIYINGLRSRPGQNHNSAAGQDLWFGPDMWQWQTRLPGCFCLRGKSDLSRPDPADQVWFQSYGSDQDMWQWQTRLLPLWQIRPRAAFALTLCPSSPHTKLAP